MEDIVNKIQCLCGKIAHFQCKKCKTIKYCSSKCKKKNRKKHEKVCSKYLDRKIPTKEEDDQCIEDLVDDMIDQMLRDNKCPCGRKAILICPQCKTSVFCSKECLQKDSNQHMKTCSEKQMMINLKVHLNKKD
uniref:MYND-type domain-containing protein n=1 Tax=Pithovirus LCPAC401 TaxID=2506595 RepID=A0A481Z9D6_9VIRU|nr:MAG: hypothetical protein LCPAC401_00550 [Pithovirus LCPAC401]